MRNSLKGFIGAGMAVALSSSVLAVYEPMPAEERGQVVSGELRTRLEYDDNIWTSEVYKQSSAKLLIMPEVQLNYPFQTSHLSVDYRFSYIWFDDRPEDDSDINHDLDADLGMEFSPRARANLTNIFRYGQDPEVDPTDVTRMRSEDFYFNTTNLGFRYGLTETLDMALAGRYFLYRYDLEEVANVQDRDTWVLGAELRKNINPSTAGSISYRYQDTGYDVNKQKDSQSHFLFGGVDHRFNSRLLGKVLAGFENRQFETDIRDDDNAPYVDVSASYNLSPKTMISGGYRLAMSETQLVNFLKSTRHGIYATLTQIITDKLFLALTTEYNLDDLDAADSASGQNDGDEKWWRISARLAYRITEIVSAEAGYMFNDLSSDFKRSYDRNRVYLGLRLTY